MLFRSPHNKAIRIEGDRSSAFTLARGRLALIVGFFLLAYMFMAARAFDLAVIQSGSYKTPLEMALGNEPVETLPQGELQEFEPVRGNIYDRNGVLLATTLPMASLYVDPALVSNAEELTKQLMEIFPDESGAALMKKVTSKGRFTWIKRNISPAQQRAILALGDPSLAFEKGRARFYPHGALASHLVGYTNIDRDGLGGIERGLEDTLAAGEDVTMAMDIRLQHILHREVKSAMTDFTAKAGAGVILDAHTGAVLAGVSLPDFNPHDAGNNDPDQLFNRLTLGVYELGSIFKIFSTAAVIEQKGIDMNDTFDATEPLRAGRFMINDYHAEDRILTVPEVFMHSSNIGSALMGQMVGTEGLRSFYSDLGLLDTMNIDIKEVGSPLVPNPWRDVSTLTASYGHGLATTPLQAASAVATVVNGGLKVTPHFLLDEQDFAAKSPSDRIQERVISPQTSEKMRALLRLVVAEGTGSKAEVAGFQVGGKTGTAEKFSARGGYDRKRLISSFMGVFPASDPDYVVFIMVDEPHGNKKSYGYATAGWVAAPAAANVIASMAGLLGLPAVEHAEKGSDDAYGSYLRRYISVEDKK